MNPKALHIAEQVRKLYHRYGIKSVTMDDVASHLGISKKTLYEHFRDKEDLVHTVLMMEHEQVCCVLQSIEGKQVNAVEEMFHVYKMINSMFQDYNQSMVYDIRKYYPTLSSKLKEVKRKVMFESAQANMNKGKAEGLYRKELNSVTVAKLHVLRVENLFNNDMFTQEELASFTLFHEVFVYHIYGILSHEGRNFFEANFDKFKASL
jgi:hypothetical protein